MIKVRRRLDVVEVLALQVIRAGVHDGIEPLGHHLMHRAACLPVALVGVVGPEDDDEGNGRDQHAGCVGMGEGRIVLIVPNGGNDEVNHDG